MNAGVWGEGLSYNRSMSDKPILITGGTGGLGPTVVKRLIDDYPCIVTYRSAGEWESLRAAIGDDERLHGFEADATQATEIENVVASIMQRWGPLYGLAHLVGGFSGGSVLDTTTDDWKRQIDLHLHSPFYAIHAVLPHLVERGEGRIIAVSSAAAARLSAGLASYNVGKLGVANLIETLANELKGTRITANVLLPGSLATPAMLKSGSPAKLVPLRYVADTIAWLLSDAAAGVTGSRIPITVTGE